MNAIEDMLANVLKTVIPKNVIDAITQMVTKENIEGIIKDWQDTKATLARIDANVQILLPTSYGERMITGAGFLTDKEPLDVQIKEEMDNGRGSGFYIGEHGYGDALPGRSNVDSNSGGSIQ